jgi:hypothetical protein
MVSKAKNKKTEAEGDEAKPKKGRRKATVKKENTGLKENPSKIEEKVVEEQGETITMMNEDKRKEAQRRLTEEERVRRLREGGETMRAELTMEESERAAKEGMAGKSYPVSEEEMERRRITGTSEAYRGYGETQQAEQAMWGKRQEAQSGRQMSQEEMRRTGSDQVNYPAGGGSYYNETFERPTGSAGPESSFGRTERVPSGREYAESETMQGRMGAIPAPEPAPTSKMGQAAGSATGMAKEKGGQVMAKGKEVGGTVVEKTKGVTSTVSQKAKEYTESGKAEDTAHRAGLAIGGALRKAASVVHELGSGLNKGLNPKEKQPPGEMAPPERGTEEMAPQRETVVREEYARETPTGGEKKYQEIRKKESQ